MINLKKFSKVGIVGFGIFLPDFVISCSEIARVWKREENIGDSLGVFQKTVADRDEDSITMATEAALAAISMAKVKVAKIGALFMGSESHPYTVKPSGTIVGEALGLATHYFCADLQFACKAGTAGLQIIASMIESGMIDYGLVIGADKAQAKPGDTLEYTAGAGAAAFLLGPKKKSLAELFYTDSYSSDTPDFWRREGEKFPQHLGRFTGEPAYFKHLEESIKDLLLKTDHKISDFEHIVFHMPNGKFPKKMAKILGVLPGQFKEGFTVPQIGNPYSASSLVGLARVLMKARAGEKILLASYGSGSGSDSFIFKTTRKIRKVRAKPDFDDLVCRFCEIDYSSYLQKMEVV